MGDAAPSGTLRVDLTTTDAAVVSVDVPPGRDVVDAAAEQAVVLPSLCGQGACGTCAATVVAGEYDHGSFSPDAMGPMNGEGAVLLCRTYPRTDLTVQLPYDATRIVSTTPPVRRATVSAIEPLTADVTRVRLTYEPDDVHGAAAEFDPGQFVQVQVPGTQTTRAYSVANIGNWDGELELLVHVLPRGVFSTWVRERAAVGDLVTVTGPQGAFGLRENGLRPRWFVAGGTGLAPMLSMLRRMADWGELQPTRLYFGVTTEHDVYGSDAIADLAARLPDFHATTCLWHPDAPDTLDDDPFHRIVAGTPADVVVRDLADVEETPDVYLCGPPAMVQAMEYALAEAGVEPQFVHTERFTAS